MVFGLVATKMSRLTALLSAALHALKVAQLLRSAACLHTN